MKGKPILLFLMLWLFTITGDVYADGGVEDIPSSRPRIPRQNPFVRLGDHTFRVPDSFYGYTVCLSSESMKDIYSVKIESDIVQFPMNLSGSYLLRIYDVGVLVYSGCINMTEDEETSNGNVFARRVISREKVIWNN